MWLSFGVVAIKAKAKGNSSEVFLKHTVNDPPFEVNDHSLSAFCFPLGADSQTPKDRMAQEVRHVNITELLRFAGPAGLAAGGKVVMAAAAVRPD